MSTSTITSNTPGGGGLNTAEPPSTSTFYEGEKVTLKIETTGLQADGYTQVQFYVAVNDELLALENPDGVTGIACHPDSEGQLLQNIGPQSAYSIDTVIMGQSSGEPATWNVSITGPGMTALGFDQNISYQTKDADIDRLWRWAILPVRSGTSVSPNAENSLHVQNYQVKDKVSGAAQNKKFSAFIQNSNQKSDLLDFNFFDKTKTQINLTSDKKVIWIDSDENGVFDFYITANTSTTVIETLTMRVGTAQVDLPSIAVFDFPSVPAQAQLDAPQLRGGGSGYDVDASQPVGVIVPKPHEAGSLTVGDTLFLVLNGQLLPETGRPYDGKLIDGGEPSFYISPNSLNFSFDGEENLMAYLVIREANTPVKSSTYKFTAYGEGGGLQINPPFPVGPLAYKNPPTINGYENGATLGYSDVKNGVTVRIKFDRNEKWPSPAQKNDKFMIYYFINGYDMGQNWDGPIYNQETAGVSPQDLLNGYIDTEIDGSNLRWWGNGPNWDQSMVAFQYKVETTDSYSASSLYTLMTIPVGGV